MTISTSANKTIALGNGSATSFAFSFVGVSASYIAVILTNSSGNETTLTAGAGPTQYQISLNAAVGDALWGVGGTVTYNPSGTPIPSGSTLTIFRTLPLTQAISLQNQASYGQFNSAAEQAIDILEMQLQQVNEDIGRALQMSITNSRGPISLPAAALLANRGLIGSPDGLDVIAGETPATGVISSAMAPVVAATTVALGRVALGLGELSLYDIGQGLQNAGGGTVRVNEPIVTITGATSVTQANHLTYFRAVGPLNIAIAAASTMQNGWSIGVFALSGAVTLIPYFADSFIGQSSGTLLVIPPNTFALIVGDGAASGTFLVEFATIPDGPIAIVPQGQVRLSIAAGLLSLSRYGGAALFIDAANRQVPAIAPVLPTTSLAANTTYYIYAYMSGASMQLEASVTVPAVDSTYGIQIKTGDSTRSLVGMARTNVTPAWILVRSWFNDPGMSFTGAFTGNPSISSGSYVELSSTIRGEFLCWDLEIVSVSATGCTFNSGANAQTTSMAFDGVSPEDTFSQSQNIANAPSPLSAALEKTGLSQGYHYVTLIGKVSGGSGTWQGSGAAGTRTTICGRLRR